jgi:hypothetical protein
MSPRKPSGPGRSPRVPKTPPTRDRSRHGALSSSESDGVDDSADIDLSGVNSTGRRPVSQPAKTVSADRKVVQVTGMKPVTPVAVVAYTKDERVYVSVRRLKVSVTSVINLAIVRVSAARRQLAFIRNRSRKMFRRPPNRS